MIAQTFAHRRALADGLRAALAGVLVPFVLADDNIASALPADFPQHDLAVGALRAAVAVFFALVGVYGLLLLLGRWPVLLETGGKIRVNIWKAVSLRDIREVNVIYKNGALLKTDAISLVLQSGKLEIINANGWMEPVDMVRDAIVAAIPTGAARQAGAPLVS